MIPEQNPSQMCSCSRCELLLVNVFVVCVLIGEGGKWHLAPGPLFTCLIITTSLNPCILARACRALLSAERFIALGILSKASAVHGLKQ